MIPNQWYAILPSKSVPQNKILTVRRLGLDLALFRDDHGQLGCVVDQCTHRGASFKVGQVVGSCIQCPFHGLEFDPHGRCMLVPSIGKATTSDLGRYNVKAYLVREAHGIIYLWNGAAELATPDLPFFDDQLTEKDVYSEFPDPWHSHYSRSIENQLDVVHLPFVHRTTIGRGNKTLVNGPKVILESINGINSIVTSANNDVDEGQLPKAAEACTIKETYLKFLFPNVWMNHISDKIRVVIYFAPVDDENTILYIRFYSRISKIRAVNQMIAFFGKPTNKKIERQDKRVVIDQKPKASAYRSKEKLVPGDGPIIAYRRIRQELIDLASEGEKTTPGT